MADLVDKIDSKDPVQTTDAYEDLLQSIQRDINCLADPDRSTRKRSIDKLKKNLLGSKKPDKGDLQGLYLVLTKPVVKLFADEIEKCRELSVETMTEFVKECVNCRPGLPYILPAVVRRIGVNPVLEGTEEIRLALLELVLAIIKIVKEDIIEYTEDIVKILEQAVVDAFPDVKKIATSIVMEMCTHVPKRIGLSSVQLCKVVMGTLGHQHSRVRVSGLQALQVLLPTGENEVVKELEPTLKHMMYDRQGPVREALMKCVGHWLLELRDRDAYDHLLLPILSAGLADELPGIQEVSMKLYEELGIKYEKENHEDLKEMMEYHIDGNEAKDGLPLAPFAPSVFKSRPRLGTRYVARNRLTKMLPTVLTDTADWTVDTRRKSAKILRALLLFGEEMVSQHMEAILGALYKGVADEEKDVAEEMTMCAKLIGYYCPLDVSLPLVIPQARGTHNMSPAHRTNALLVLACLIAGARPTVVEPHIKEIMDALSEPAFAHCEHSDFQSQLLHAVHNLIQSGGAACKEESRRVFCLLLQLQAVRDNQLLVQQVGVVLKEVAEVFGLASPKVFYNQHFVEILRPLLTTYTAWTRGSPMRHLFETLVENAGGIAGNYLKEIMPAFVHCCHVDRDGEMRNSFLILLNKMLREADLRGPFQDHAKSILADIIVPNCVWKVGKVAAAIRKSAMSCAEILLAQKIAHPMVLATVVADFVPVMKSCLEDDVADLRLLACRTLLHFFTIIEGLIDEESLRHIYPDLLKRLDDSNDDVRLEVCPAFVAFLKGIPYGYSDVHVEYMVHHLLIHLDDNNDDIPKAVMPVLKELVRLNPSLALTETKAAQAKHRNTRPCQELLNYIESYTPS
eukprot:GFYU01002461.1.p1 GENE.GFYU01002461.1~~GFYU01002461.1.p1  ORF type:complete len:852 (-),score=283.55 GFYU01002461.1:130-2685(-)